MSVTLRLENFEDVNIAEKTSLTSVASASASPVNLSVTNSQGYAVGNFVVVGRLGVDNGELKAVTAIPDANHVTVATLDRNHVSGEPVTRVFGDKVQLYRAANVDGTTPADASFSVVGSPVAIQADQSYTDVTDATGGVGFWYKYVYYNSTTFAVTDIAVATPKRPTTSYASLNDIRRDAGYANNPNIADSDIDFQRQAAQAYIDGQLSGLYDVPFAAPINPQIAKATTLIAAGYLRNDQTTLSTNPGNEKITEGQAIISSIKSGQLTLVGANNVVTPTTGTVDTGFSGWPNRTTADADSTKNGGDFLFRVSDRY